MNLERIEELTRELEKELATDIPECTEDLNPNPQNTQASLARDIASRLFDASKAEHYGGCRYCGN